MRKNYLFILFVFLTFYGFSQTTRTVKDTLGAAFYVEYTTVADQNGVTLTVDITENLGSLNDITDMEIYRTDGDNRISGRSRIAKGITTASSGQVVFIDNHQTWTADESGTYGYVGTDPFDVGRPRTYSIKLIAGENSFSSGRAIQSVYIPDYENPDAVVDDQINRDMNLRTKVYSNYPDSETVLIEISLLPSLSYPNDPYKLYQDAILARTGDGTFNWGAYPIFISNLYFNDVEELAGRAGDLNANRIFASSTGPMYHLIEKEDIPAEKINSEGLTYFSFKFGRPSAAQPGNGFTYDASRSVVIPISNTLSTEAVGLDKGPRLMAVGNQVKVINVSSHTAIDIFTISGALVRSLTTSTAIDLQLNPGIYIGNLTSEMGRTSVKLLLQ